MSSTTALVCTPVAVKLGGRVIGGFPLGVFIFLNSFSWSILVTWSMTCREIVSWTTSLSSPPSLKTSIQPPLAWTLKSTYHTHQWRLYWGDERGLIFLWNFRFLVLVIMIHTSYMIREDVFCSTSSLGSPPSPQDIEVTATGLNSSIEPSYTPLAVIWGSGR